MNIKILSSLTDETKKRNDVLTIGTHNGIFHSDDVLACAILCLNYSSDLSVQIIRTRNLETLTQCTLCVDIGGGEYDHHQAGFNKTRENGIMYASAGLVWNNYGKNLIKLILKKYFSETNCNVNSIFKSVDSTFISSVDCEDNGIYTETHCFSFITSFLPLWFNNSQNDFDNQFNKVLLITVEILEQKLKTIISKEISKNIIESNWKSNSFFNSGILEIPSQTIDWVETVIDINSCTEFNKINFVIFPYPNGGWAAQCVPLSLNDKFSQRIPFPSEWAGQTDTLSKISKVEGATFCHNGRFFIRAISKESIIKMCTFATNLVN